MVEFRRVNLVREEDALGGRVRDDVVDEGENSLTIPDHDKVFDVVDIERLANRSGLADPCVTLQVQNQRVRFVTDGFPDLVDRRHPLGV
jgi:hypothetical protein